MGCHYLNAACYPNSKKSGCYIKTQNTTTAAGFTPAAFCSLYKKHRKYIGKRAGKGYNVRESVIDKIQTFFSALSGHK